jgi:uncharacterized glyoxalase superfamily protein PhnB
MTHDVAWPDTLPESEAPGPDMAPYLAIQDAVRAIGWYGAVFDARLVGEVFEDHAEGRRLITHASLAIGDSLLMLAEARVAEDYIAAETGRPVGGRSADSVWVRVADVDATLARAAELGAEITRPAREEPFGRTGAMVDPFGRRWLVQSE